MTLVVVLSVVVVVSVVVDTSVDAEFDLFSKEYRTANKMPPRTRNVQINGNMTRRNERRRLHGLRFLTRRLKLTI